MKAVVFDIGNVLVQWDPHLAWLEEMGSREAVAEFLTRINFPERNLRADGGEMFADLAAELDNAEDHIDHKKWLALLFSIRMLDRSLDAD